MHVRPPDFLKDISIVYAYRCTPAGSAGACGSLDMHVDLCVYGLHPATQNTTSFVSQEAERAGGTFQGLLRSVSPQLLHLSPSDLSNGRLNEARETFANQSRRHFRGGQV